MTRSRTSWNVDLAKGLVSATLLLALASPAFAVSVINKDTKEHTVTVDLGSTETNKKFATGDTLQIECPERCGLRVVGSGYGRQPGPDGKLLIDKGGMLRFTDETGAPKAQ
ncbi:hypothetical protein PMNALOAF_0474 [Methylobacterium adhaesivum]|uniref:Uncharacterized protein n=1 Tax=Methylobacterium adhaesivum TaxID=333297 RepID=A0ABT8BEB6_9HYPH|nr:hypothetical protein [Methylobacterium adhaesivum]MDN3590174.1 hypothetical protein [Methylobacterium adhaesivum]GJD29242.1 hypothetical protein PMNALOAF_0474 [Methylobacterium adhaesivum]